MRRIANRIRQTGIAVILLASACTVGPNFKHPDAPSVKGYTDSELPKQTATAPTPAGASQKFRDNAEIPAQWWTLFACEPLNTLMEQALKANPDLQAAQASLRQA